MTTCDPRKILTDLNVAGKIINTDFFPFTEFDGTDLIIVSNAGVIVPGGVGTNLDSITRYYINRLTTSQTVTTTTQFVETAGWVALDGIEAQETIVDNLVTTNSAADTVRTQRGNVISARFGD